MPGLVIVGTQWGDEGKGKIVDTITAGVDAVVRYQGGNNAGHTLVVDGQTTKLSLVPSGILHDSTACLIGAGVVIDCEVLAAEVDKLRQAGVKITPERLVIDRDAQLILEYHRVLDLAREEALGVDKIGTTGRGNGPAYEDRARRCGIRVAELANLELLKPRLEALVAERNLYLSSVFASKRQVSFEEVWVSLKDAAALVLPFMGNVSLLIDQAMQRGERIVFEGAQGTLLDQVHGTIPFVTSSNTLAGAVCTGAGVGPHRIDVVLGIAKAYCTRVGSGPFPTELTCQTGEDIAKKGAEFGTVTGRARRCGWLDLVALKRAVRLNGIDCLAITKLDVLSGLPVLKVCDGYSLDGKKLDDLPALASELARVEPNFIELSGWSEVLDGIREWGDLPAAAREYLETLAKLVQVPIALVSVGAERKSMIAGPGVDLLAQFKKI